MSTKIKIIITVIISLIIVVSVICLFVYINHLNNKISELETITIEQTHTIEVLQNNINTLNTNLNTYHETLNTVSDYIESIEQFKSNDSAIKQAIYEEVLSNPESMDWFNEKLPDNIISIINDRAADGMCNN
jgi:flagellar basal body-associated protein FliL